MFLYGLKSGPEAKILPYFRSPGFHGFLLHPARSRPCSPLLSPGDITGVLSFPDHEVDVGSSARLFQRWRRESRGWGIPVGCGQVLGGCLLEEGCQGSERADPAQFAPSYGGRPTTEQLHLRAVSF